ncbi:MAG TPA: neutral zinc metallopeptidase [Acidimicrobiales bacterium]|nr:neutral zinc metallopeptidase [Acidimicrobiales bacterium]
MRWRRSEGETYERGPRPGGLALPVTAGGGVIGLLVLLASVLLGGGGAGGGMGDVLQSDLGAPGPETERDQFVAFVADDTQQVWAGIFAREGRRYRAAVVRSFQGRVSTACGTATSAVGPFYCPADERVYLDLGFFDELASRFEAPGDFAQAYVVAHEIGHHVQKLTGVSDRVRARQQAARSQEEANVLSVRLELQADCYAGIWAHSVYERGQRRDSDIALEPGDIEEGLAAARGVGDDRLQAQAGMRIDPETWTHGSSEQRQGWFRRGFESGDPGACDTFADA